MSNVLTKKCLLSLLLLLAAVSFCAAKLLPAADGAGLSQMEQIHPGKHDHLLGLGHRASFQQSHRFQSQAGNSSAVVSAANFGSTELHWQGFKALPNVYHNAPIAPRWLLFRSLLI